MGPLLELALTGPLLSWWSPSHLQVHCCQPPWDLGNDHSGTAISHHHQLLPEIRTLSFQVSRLTPHLSLYTELKVPLSGSISWSLCTDQPFVLTRCHVASLLISTFLQFSSLPFSLTWSVHRILALGSAMTVSGPGAQSCTGKAQHLKGLCKEQQPSMSRVTDLALVIPQTLPGTEWTGLCGKILSQYINK